MSDIGCWGDGIADLEAQPLLVPPTVLLRMNYGQLKKTLKDLTTTMPLENPEASENVRQGKENTTPDQSLIKEEHPAAVERKEEVEPRPEEEYEAGRTGRRPALVQDLMHSSLAVRPHRGCLICASTPCKDRDLRSGESSSGLGMNLGGGGGGVQRPAPDFRDL